METKYTKEDLAQNLPDYISFKINDADLISNIENEIEANPEFKMEFENIKKTLEFLNSAELDSPQENYFNNLSVKISEKISNEESKLNIWEKLSLKWKILIPSIPAVIIALILFNTFTNNTREILLADKGRLNNELTEISKNENSENETNLKNEILNPNPEKSEKKDIKSDRTIHSKKKQAEKINQSNFTSVEKSEPVSEETETTESLISQNSDISDLTSIDSDEDVLFLKVTEEENLEDELMELTPNEQNEIIESLSKTQI